VLDQFRAAMDDDLDTPRAIALISDTLRRANAAADEGGDGDALAGQVAVMTAALGLFPGSGPALGTDVVELVARLDDARTRRDYAEADAIRAELGDKGWLVETGPEGSRVKPKRD
jgi:cysteinyl-tRNA synthetase